MPVSSGAANSPVAACFTLPKFLINPKLISSIQKCCKPYDDNNMIKIQHPNDNHGWQNMVITQKCVKGIKQELDKIWCRI
jgi:hypothetical protein